MNLPRFSLKILITTLIFLTSASYAQTVSVNTPFNFIVLADTAYRTPEDYPHFAQLIESINGQKPAFTIHLGDTGGHDACSDKAQENIATLFSRFEHPLIYTPGDNEWTDCKADYDPLERLQKIRKRFFPTKRQSWQESHAYHPSKRYFQTQSLC